MTDSVSTEAAAPQVVRRDEYRVPDFLIDTVDLTFDLDPADTRRAFAEREWHPPSVSARTSSDSTPKRPVIIRSPIDAAALLRLSLNSSGSK